MLVPEVLSANLQESIDWLKDNSEPWDLVLNHWKATSKYRMDTHNDEITKRDVREEWALYAHPSSRQLIDIDFESLKKSNIKMSFTSWSNFFQTLCETTTLQSKDETGSDLLDKYNLPTSSEGIFFLIQDTDEYIVVNENDLVDYRSYSGHTMPNFKIYVP